MSRREAAVAHLGPGASSRDRRRRRVLNVGRWGTLIFVLIIGAVVWQILERSRIYGTPVIVELIGEATVGTSTRTVSAQVGMRLGRGQQLRMGWEDSRVLLRYADGTTVAVHDGAVAEVPERVKNVTLRLVSGALEVNAALQPPGRQANPAGHSPVRLRPKGPAATMQ